MIVTPAPDGHVFMTISFLECVVWRDQLYELHKLFYQVLHLQITTIYYYVITYNIKSISTFAPDMAESYHTLLRMHRLVKHKVCVRKKDTFLCKLQFQTNK